MSGSPRRKRAIPQVRTVSVPMTEEMYAAITDAAEAYQVDLARIAREALELGLGPALAARKEAAAKAARTRSASRREL